MTNTIQINRSFSATGPGETLLDGELAYSYVSNSLYIGNSGGAGNAAWTLFGGNTGDINWIGITAGDGLTGTIITGSGNHAQTLSIDSTAKIVVAGISSDGGATFGGDVRIQNAGDVALYILSDTDNADEDDHPLIRLSQDNNYHALDIGIGGFQTDTPYFDTDNDLAIDFGTDGTRRMQIEGTSGQVNFLGGISADAGATFGGNIVVPDDAFIGVGSDEERIIFDSNGNDITLQSATILIPNKLQHLNDPDTFLDFTTDNTKMQSGGNVFLEGTSSQVHFPLGVSADAGATFGGDIKVNNLTIGLGGGGTVDNTAVGYNTLNSNTTGKRNVAVGYYSLAANLTGDSNVAVGYYSLAANITGGNNTAVGHQSLTVSKGDSNTAVGRRSLYGATISTYNTALGYGAGSNATTGDNNTFLGYNAQPSSAIANNEIVLGNSDAHIIHSAAGMSLDGGATFGGDVTFQGNILLPDDGSVGIGGDTEKISFNGSGSGSSSIDIQGSVVDFGVGSGCSLRSHGDYDTRLQFENDLHGAGNDGLQLIQSNNVMVDVNPTDVNVAGATFGSAGATFGGPVIITNVGDATLTLNADTDNAGSEDDNPHILFTQDNGSNTFKMGMVGVAGTIFTNSYSDRPYLSSHWGFQLATKGTAAVSVDVNQKVHLHGGGTFGGLSSDAGATFGGAVNLVDNQITRPELKDYAETVNAIGTVTSDTDIDIELGNVQTVTVGGDCEFVFENWPATGIAGTLTLIITNAGNYTTTWDTPVKWPGDNAPAGTSGGVDIVSFMSIDAGTTVYGFVGGINFS